MKTTLMKRSLRFDVSGPRRAGVLPATLWLMILMLMPAGATAFEGLYPMSDPLLLIEDFGVRMQRVAVGIKKLRENDALTRCTFYHLAEKPRGFIIEKVTRLLNPEDTVNLPSYETLGYRLITFDSARQPETQACAIPQELAVAVCRLWDKLLATTAVSDEFMLGADGDTYILGSPNVRPMQASGMAWSPPPETPLGAAVLVAQRLCTAPANQAIWDEYLKQVKDIQKALEARTAKK